MERKSEISKDHFEVYIDVKNFEPDEITVRTVNETVIVEGRQKKRDKNAIPRHFVRHFRLPHHFDSEDVHSYISEDGILEVKALPASEKKKARSTKTVDNGPEQK